MLAPPVVRSTRRASLLLLEMDQVLAEQLGERLRQVGFRVSLSPGTQKSESALALVQLENPDLIILAAGPGGLRLCRALRQATYSLPVLLLSDGETISERVAGLDVGADDYIVSPFDIAALVDRIQCQLKRVQGRESGVLRLADLIVNTRTREVRRGGQLIELTAREYDLLHYLIEHAREVLSRERILLNVWGESFDGESNIVEVYIRYLRLKIEREGEKKLIHTVRSVGYSLRD
ncbi:response regulator transcription factor [Gloeobacter violaceus]|uniref:Two-component response regulator n=1 Tax=Gloeobacter violaceus (strain ATCC 29082 / PCC 7421) TaxID=251221 RepID=Q7NGT9_GLOVI|nr:response regulator transcription factor [Gloeobacter violaceus]BAC90739.1 two-component response regulator [Gloeobacter violaceus PCC 7421]